MRTVRAIGIICLLTIPGMAGDLVTSFKEAAALGDAQEKAPATRDYFERNLLPYYQQKYGPVLQSCFASTTQPDSAPFAFVAAIGADGRVMRMYADHETNIFGCVRQTLDKDKFPKPPVFPYYLHIDMQFTDAETHGSGESAPPLIVEPDKYSYTFGVPTDWEFSFEQAHKRGAALAFFPKDGSFNDSSSVIYVNEIDDGCIRCLNALSDRIANIMQSVKDDSPTVQIATEVPVKTKDGGVAQIRLLKGAPDPRDRKARKDNEALGFIGHDETIILIVLTVRDTRTWDRDYSAFQQVIAGHKFFNCKSPDLRVPCSR
jgi:hypothetical protein